MYLYIYIYIYSNVYMAASVPLSNRASRIHITLFEFIFHSIFTSFIFKIYHFLSHLVQTTSTELSW